MEAPKTVNWGGEFLEGEKCPQYIRSDLVDKLKGYAVHKYDCRADEAPEGMNPCTCGLTEVFKEMGDA